MVNFLWSTRQQNFFFEKFGRESSPYRDGCRPSYFVSLVSPDEVRRITALLKFIFPNSYILVRHRFERTIAGRPFVIEVTWVAENRWRAHIVRIPGVPTAMMPFYGETPDEAAAHLSDWLNRAHQHQADTV